MSDPTAPLTEADVEALREILAASYDPERIGIRAINKLADLALTALRAQQAQPVEVRLGNLQESNGRSTWIVALAKPGDSVFDHLQVYADSIKGRAEYERDRLLHFFGQGPEPDITSYDTDDLAQTRREVVEECIAHVKNAKLTYAGPDPQGIRDLRTLIVMSLEDLLAPAIQQGKETKNG